jgi:metal-sulfur cluster biosynthetic enzyme
MTPRKTSGRDPTKALERKVIEALRTIQDPAIPYNLYDLGCIYGLKVTADGQVEVLLTMTDRGHPDGLTLPGRVRRLLLEVKGVTEVQVQLTGDPPWTTDRMTDLARRELTTVG